MTEKPKLDKNEMAKKPKWSECEPTTEKKTLPLCRPQKKLIYPDSVQKAESLKKKKNVLAMKKRVSLPGPSPNPFLWIVSTMSLFV